MNKYELVVVVNAVIEDDARAYEIQKMNDGFYYFIKFEAETTAIAEIESQMRIMDNVLRYLCVKVEE